MVRINVVTMRENSAMGLSHLVITQLV